MIALPTVREVAATPDWDRRVVEAPGGDVRQTTVWANHWELFGWRPRYLLYDGIPVLALGLPGPQPLSTGYYLPRGPIPDPGDPFRTIARLSAVTEYLHRQGADSVSSDAAVLVTSGYLRLLRDAGFSRAPEAEPSRNTMRLQPADAAPGARFRSFSHGVRESIRVAVRRGVRVIGYGTAFGNALADIPVEWQCDPADTVAALQRFHAMLSATAMRRGFSIGPRERVLDWQRRAIDAHLAAYLEARSPEGDVLGGAVFHRAGGTVTYAHGTDVLERRRAYPGVPHLLVWRAIAIADELHEQVDLGGVDVAGAREVPMPADPLYGLYRFKRGFGAQWVELAGHHRRVVRPASYVVRRVVGRAARLAGDVTAVR